MGGGWNWFRIKSQCRVVTISEIICTSKIVLLSSVG